ncbi:MAG: Proton/glutamate-aspartate symporter [Holosporales bacterium]
MKLWKQVLIGLALGIILGFILGERAVYLKPFGDIFIRLVKTMIVPLVFFAIITGISNLPDKKSLGRIGGKALFSYLMTTLFAISIGLGVGILFEPGVGLNLTFDLTNDSATNQPTGFFKIMDTLLNVIPENGIEAMSKGNMLQVVFFAFFVGFGVMSMEDESARKLKSGLRVASSLMFTLIGLIIKLSPVSACCLTAWIIGVQGADILQKLIYLVGCTYFAFGIQYGIFALMILLWARLSPKPFLKKSIEYQLIAFSTTSSKAALPITIDVSRKKLGVSDVSSSFILPLGASINMDGTAICIGLFSLFLAQGMGKILTPYDYACIMTMGTLGSIGAAGIPGGTLVMLPMVLIGVGVPIEGIALLAGIDRITDFMRTTISITGDAVVALCIDKSEGLLDVERYNRMDS